MLTETLENGHHVWSTVIYREFDTNLNFLLKSKVNHDLTSSFSSSKLHASIRVLSKLVTYVHGR